MMRAGKFATPPKVAKAPRPPKIHPSATNPRIRLPQGNTGAGDPAPFLPGVGKI